MLKKDSQFAIKATNLEKIYIGKKENKKALNSINLEIPYGSFFGLLGPNGAGKSTFINILGGIVNKFSGEVSICGHDIIKESMQARKSIGIVPQEIFIDPFFPVYDVLEYTAGYYGIKKSERRTNEILEALGLKEKAFIPSRKLSGGMKRRLLVAKALVHSPKVLILDEPTAGVDVELRVQLWDYIKKLNKEKGTTVILTTHYLEEAEKLCDNIAVIDNGNIIANDSKNNLIKLLDNKKVIITTDSNIKKIPKELENFEVAIDGKSLEITYRKSKLNINKILQVLGKMDLKITDLSTKEDNLEEVFVYLTNK